MNRGSALKWIELIKSGNYNFNDRGGLKYSDNTFCPVGVLEDFITPNSWIDTTVGFFVNTDRSTSYPSENTRKRCKLKTNLQEAISFFESNSDPEKWCKWIELNYERL